MSDNKERKVLFGYDYTDNETVKLIIYLCIGGAAALVEWSLFALLTYRAGVNYLAAAALAFTVSTTCHYFMGNALVFRSGSRYTKGREFTLVFLVSVVGLLFNLILMYLFVDHMKISPMAGKILASAIVVIWNYLSRKMWIFKEAG